MLFKKHLKIPLLFYANSIYSSELFTSLRALCTKQAACQDISYRLQFIQLNTIPQLTIVPLLPEGSVSRDWYTAL